MGTDIYKDNGHKKLNILMWRAFDGVALEFFVMSRVSRSSDVLDFRSAITKQFSVLVPTTEGDLASVHYKSTMQEKSQISHTWKMFFSCLAEHEVEDTGGCQAVLVVLRSSQLDSDFFNSFIVTLLQGSCDFEHSTESGRLPSDVNSVLPSSCPALRDWWS